MKRTLSILTLSLALILSSIAPARSASAIEFLAPGDTVIDIAELLEWMPQVKEELKEACPEGAESRCRQNFYESLRTGSGRGAALYGFLGRMLVITSINPAKQTMKILYGNTDLYGWRNISEEDNTITELRIGWYEFDNPTNMEIPQDPADAPDYFHYVYNAQGFDWIKPYVEQEITWDEAVSFGVNPEEYMYFNIRSTGSNSMGPVSFSDCIGSPYYEDGMECRAHFIEKETGNIIYLPFKEDGTPAYPYSEYDKNTSSEEPSVTEPEDGQEEEPEDDEPVVLVPEDEEDDELIVVNPEEDEDVVTPSPEENEDAVVPEDTVVPEDAITPDPKEDNVTAGPNDSSNENEPSSNLIATVSPSVSTLSKISTASSTSSAIVAASTATNDADTTAQDDASLEATTIVTDALKESADIPLGGELEETDSSSDFSFPWWALAAALIGGAACAWFFWPKVRKN